MFDMVAEIGEQCRKNPGLKQNDLLPVGNLLEDFSLCISVGRRKAPFFQMTAVPDEEVLREAKEDDEETVSAFSQHH